MGSVAEGPTVALVGAMVSPQPRQRGARPMQLQRETVVTGLKAGQEGEGRLCTYLKVLGA